LKNNEVTLRKARAVEKKKDVARVDRKYLKVKKADKDSNSYHSDHDFP